MVVCKMLAALPEIQLLPKDLFYFLPAVKSYWKKYKKK